MDVKEYTKEEFLDLIIKYRERFLESYNRGEIGQEAPNYLLEVQEKLQSYTTPLDKEAMRAVVQVVFVSINNIMKLEILRSFAKAETNIQETVNAGRNLLH